MNSVYKLVKEFDAKYSGSVNWWRNKKHSKIVEEHLNPDEKALFAFSAQKNDSPFDFFNTYVFVLTNKRILMGRKRLLFGSFLISVTPDLFNDLKIYKGIFWGKVTIDTVKELIVFSNVSKKGLEEIETKVSTFMMNEKKKYGMHNFHHVQD